MVNEESFVEGNEIETETLVKQYIKHLPTIDKNCDKDQVIPKVTLAQSLLLEEFPRTCALCLELLSSDEQICCEATHGQISYNLLLNNKTLVKKVIISPRLTPVCVDKNISDKSKENQDNEYGNSVLKEKELRQLELKLKKKEESLKLKELSLNEKLKEKTKLIEYLHQLETRNTELELTIKTMNRKIIILEENHQNNLSLRHEKSQSVKLNSHSGELLVQVRNKVTKFIVRRIENELDKLTNNLSENNDKTKDTQNLLNQQNVNGNSENHYSQHNWGYQNCYQQYPYTYYYDHQNSYYTESNETENEGYSNSYVKCDHENQWPRDSSQDNNQNVSHANLIDVLALNNQLMTNHTLTSGSQSNQPSNYLGQNLYFQKEALKLLNLNKSPDIFGISTENLLYGGQSLIYHPKELLDSTFRLCYIPDEQKLGIVIPLFKNKGMCKDSKNYRGITITPTLPKLIEAVLKIRINPDIIKYQNPLQCGFTRRTALLNCSFIIEEFHKECVELNDQTIILSLMQSQHLMQ
ncbi:unnamed protein product [Mytilus coruscus]|uniref:Reverse transcriptase domain-containing protein n=1 Tax=Mytilus coruscus TaxID=42192 RepID=A0A6J8E7G8_MYTCO|nr:unnamed protein product [Mytilus coruscus]